MSDTVAAIGTPLGEGGIGIIRISSLSDEREQPAPVRVAFKVCYSFKAE